MKANNADDRFVYVALNDKRYGNVKSKPKITRSTRIAQTSHEMSVIMQ